MPWEVPSGMSFPGQGLPGGLPQHGAVPPQGGLPHQAGGIAGIYGPGMPCGLPTYYGMGMHGTPPFGLMPGCFGGGLQPMHPGAMPALHPGLFQQAPLSSAYQVPAPCPVPHQVPSEGPQQAPSHAVPQHGPSAVPVQEPGNTGGSQSQSNSPKAHGVQAEPDDPWSRYKSQQEPQGRPAAVETAQQFSAALREERPGFAAKSVSSAFEAMGKAVPTSPAAPSTVTKSCC